MNAPLARKLLIGVDIGGTFTDIVLMDAASGHIHTDKLPTTPKDQSVAFAEGIRRASETRGLPPSSILRVLHGTTVATNAVLEGKGAVAALITTEGFRHVLEIGRHDIPRKANMFSWIKPTRPVPPERIFEVAGRIDLDGAEHQALDEAGLRGIADAIAASGVLSVAVCLLHSYVNPAHEERVRAILTEVVPDVQISLSSDVLPVFREYERSMATILNAYVMPPVSHYVSRLDERLTANGIEAPLLLMKSSGGVMSAEAVNRTPIQTVLSGPAAGALGAADIALAAGFANVISIDIGGTSADVCLIRDGAPALTMRGHIGDWPLHTTMLDIVTIGAGGGSIARMSGGGGLAVGPESAGAEPGPACYGRGGTEPTVTDAHLVLGRMSGALLGDAFSLDADAAHAAVARLASRLGLSAKATAEGIIDVANNAMVGAIRLVSVERGLDPRDFALLAFGGAGPLHGAQLAQLLGMKTVIVPPNPGVLSAYGLLVADIRNDFSRTCVERPDYDLGRIAEVFADLESKARAWLDAEGIAPGDQSTEWSLSLRYRHQGFELTVPMAEARIDAKVVGDAVAGFHALHERLYTFAQPDTPVEVVTLHVAAVGRLPQPAKQLRAAVTGSEPTILRRQSMHVDGRDYDCPVYDRASLGSDRSIKGPAVIAQHDSTTVVMPGQTAWVHQAGSILIS